MTGNLPGANAHSNQAAIRSGLRSVLAFFKENRLFTSGFLLLLMLLLFGIIGSLTVGRKWLIWGQRRLTSDPQRSIY